MDLHDRDRKTTDDLVVGRPAGYEMAFPWSGMVVLPSIAREKKQLQTKRAVWT